MEALKKHVLSVLPQLNFCAAVEKHYYVSVVFSVVKKSYNKFILLKIFLRTAQKILNELLKDKSCLIPMEMALVSSRRVHFREFLACHLLVSYAHL